MIFYIILIFFSIGLFLIAYIYPETDASLSLLFLGVLIVIGGLRDGIGWDYQSYIEWYLKGTRDQGEHSLELGFLGLLKLFRFFNLHYYYLFFIVAFFTYVFVYLGLKRYTRNTTLPLVVYSLIPTMFLYSFTFIRQFLAVAICFYAFNLLLDKKYLKFATLMVMAVSIHYTAALVFIVFLAVFIWEDKIKFKHLYVAVVLSFIISQIGIIHFLELIFRKSHYLFYVSNQAIPVPYLKLLVINGMGCIIIAFYKNYGFENLKHFFFLILYVVSIVLLNLFSESVELTRIYIYFRIFEIALVGPIIYSAIHNNRLWLLSLFFCFYTLPYLRSVIVDTTSQSPSQNKLIPYRSILFKINS